MIKELILSANDEKTALSEASKELGINENDLKLTLIKPAKKSLFGKIKEMAQFKIEYTEKSNDTLKDNKTINKSSATKEDSLDGASEEVKQKLQIAKDYLNSIIAEFNIGDIDISTSFKNNKVYFDISGDKVGTLIGKRGETIDALQYLVSLTANHGGGEYVRFIIDSGNFREKREATLKELGERIAKKALKQGRKVTLEPMNPFDRRIIHAAVGEVEGVFSKSVGEEPNRKVVVYAENPKPYAKKSQPKDDDYVIPSDTSSAPSTYDFEKEFLKNDSSSYGKL